MWTCETIPNEADPPVFSDASAFDGRDDGMREVCPSLSHFLTTFCLHELVFGSQHLFCVDLETVILRELVVTDLEELWIDGMYAYLGAKYSFYLCRNELMIMASGSACTWIACKTDAGLKWISPLPEIRRVH